MDITRKKILNLGLVLIGLYILWYSSIVLAYIAASLVLALILSPLNQLMRKVKFKGIGINRGLASGVSMMIVVGLIVVITNIFVPVVSREIKLLSSVKMDEFYDVIEPEIKSVKKLFSIEAIDKAGEKSEKEVIKNFLLGKKNLDRVPSFFTGIASGIGGSIIALFSVFFITFFLLKDDELFNGFVYSFSDDENVDKVKNVLDKIKITLSRYFIGIVIQVSVITFFVALGLSILGIRNAIIIGLFAGLMNVIPYVGPIIGLAFGLLIGVSTNIELVNQLGFWSLIGELLLVFGITQAIDNFVTQPVVFSKSINAHPLEIFLVILIAGNLGGIPWMIIAVPLYSVIRIIAKEYYGDSKFVRFMTQTMK